MTAAGLTLQPTFANVADLLAATSPFIDAYNDVASPFKWIKTADQILTFAMCLKTSDPRR